MRSMLRLSAIVVTLCGCHPAVPPDVLQQYQSAPLYTCCNFHYESGEINDANYQVGALLPLGTPVQITRMDDESVTFTAGGQAFTLYHRYGVNQEARQTYFDKILVRDDPKRRVESFSRAVQQTVRNGRVKQA